MNTMYRLQDDPLYMARYGRNLAVLERRYNALYRYLENVSDQSIELYIKNGQPYAFRGNACLYKGNQQTDLQGIIRNDLKFPCIKPSKREAVADRMLERNEIFRTYYHKLHDLVESYVSSNQTFQAGKKHVPLIFFYGVAEGIRLEQILQIFDVRHIVLMEQHIEMLRVSLCFANWSKILDLIEEKNTELNVLVNNDSDQLYREALGCMSKSNPAFMYSAWHLFQYQADVFTKTYESLCEEVYRLFYLWPVDTEIRNCRATIQNLKDRPKVLRSRPDPGDRPNEGLSAAAIVGAGPSIDKDIEVLRKNAQNLTVFSCGSALMTLYENAIVPDYHVDIERQHNMQTYLAYIDPDYLRRIHVLYPMYFRPLPENVNLFRDCSYFFIKGEYHQDLVNDTTVCLKLDGGLTVTSHALGLVLKTGFDVIFLMGCDLGFVDNQIHHSIHHLYYRSDSPVQKDHKTSFIVPGNFKKYVGTDRTFHCELDTYKRLTKKNTTATIFNLSDGVKIERTHPLPSKYLHTSHFRKMKIHNNRQISTNFDFFSACNLHFLYKAALQDIENMLSQTMTDFGRFIDLCMDLNTYLNDKLAKHQYMLFKILQNSMKQYMTIVFSNAYVIEDEHEVLTFVEQANGLLRGFLRDIEPQITKLQTEAAHVEIEAGCAGRA